LLTEDFNMKKKNPYNWLRWIARISGTLMVVFTLIMAIGEFIEGQKRSTGALQTSFTPLILTIFVIWGIALIGLVLSLWKEGLGGIISIISFMLMYILNLFNKEAVMRGNAIIVFLIFSIPSILYLIYWKLNKDGLK
jgi:hypothetical protein